MVTVGSDEEFDFQLLPVRVGQFVEHPRGRLPVGQFLEHCHARCPAGQYGGHRCVQRLLVGRFVEHHRVRCPLVGRYAGRRCGPPPARLLDFPVTRQSASFLSKIIVSFQLKMEDFT